MTEIMYPKDLLTYDETILCYSVEELYQTYKAIVKAIVESDPGCTKYRSIIANIICADDFEFSTENPFMTIDMTNSFEWVYLNDPTDTAFVVSCGAWYIGVNHDRFCECCRDEMDRKKKPIVLKLIINSSINVFVIVKSLKLGFSE